jgi:virulence-associated protein VagC
MDILTKTVVIKNHILHLDMVLPKDFIANKVKVTITAEDDCVVENPIKNLRGKLNFSEKQYNDIQDFLNEDR